MKNSNINGAFGVVLILSVMCTEIAPETSAVFCQFCLRPSLEHLENFLTEPLLTEELNLLRRFYSTRQLFLFPMNHILGIKTLNNFCNSLLFTIVLYLYFLGISAQSGILEQGNTFYSIESGFLKRMYLVDSMSLQSCLVKEIPEHRKFKKMAGKLPRLDKFSLVCPQSLIKIKFLILIKSFPKFHQNLFQLFKDGCVD